MSRRRYALLMGLVSFLYLWPVPYHPEINNPNENVRLYMTAAIVDEGTYQIDAIRQRWGWCNDAARYEGRHYSVKAPGTSLLGVPAYAAYRGLTAVFGLPFERTVALWCCRLSATVLPMLVFFAWLLLWLHHQTPHPFVRDGVWLSLALGSLLYGYGLLFVSHALSAAAAFSAFVLLWEHRRGNELRPAAAALTGLLVAGVTALEYPGILASVPLTALALRWLRGRRLLAAFVGGAALPTLAVMHFQWRAFGSPFSPGHRHVETAAFRAIHDRGFFGATTLHTDALRDLLFSPAVGLFALTPILIFAGVGALLLVRDALGAEGALRRLRAGVVASVVLVFATVLAIAMMDHWRGGWTLGPRYLAVAFPFVGWWAVRGLNAVASLAPIAAQASAWGAALAAIALQGGLSAWYPHVPPAIDLPLRDLWWPMVHGGFAPLTLGAGLGWYGMSTMWPWFAAAVLAWALASGGFPSARRAVVGAVGALVIAATLVMPHALPAAQGGEAETARSRSTRAFVLEHFAPPGHDRAARLERVLPALTGEDERRARAELEALWRTQGRDKRANSLRRRTRARARKD